MNKSFFVPILAAACMLSGCSDLNMENFRKHKLQPEMFFDFNTTSRVKIDIDYGEYGAHTLVSLFSDDPTISDEESTKPLFKAFTDEDGKIMTSFEMPDAIGDSVYLYTSALGTPQLVKAAVSDSTIRYKYERMQYSTEGISTRVIDWPYFGYDDGYLHCILNWWGDQRHAKIGDHNQLIQSSCLVPSSRLPEITKAFWNGSYSRPAKLSNASCVTSSDINIMTTQDGVKVFFTFLTEYSKYMDAIGYYFYPIGNCPSDFSSMHKFIIFPNSSVAGNTPYGVYGSDSFSYNDAPVSNMTTVQLLYVDYSSGGCVISEYFPKDMAIGFFAVKDAWTVHSYNGELTVNNGNFVYTDFKMNLGMRVYFIRKDAEDYAVYGLEHGDDASYDDILFTMQASPADGIGYFPPQIPITPYIPEPEEPEFDDEDFEYNSKNEIFRTYCYEDLWPVKGDYDMNDVVIDHRSRMFTDSNNKVIKIIDEFTVCNRYMSAQVSDAFAVVIPKSQRGSITIPSNAVDESETGAIILFDDVQNHLDETATIVRDFSGMSLTSGDINTDLDPFIIPLIDNIDFLSDDRREVHMPKKQGTKKLDESLLGMAQEAYFVDKDGKHPFAITIPLSVKNGEYTLTGEMKQIDSEYPYFTSWAESYGKDNKDWYTTYR